MGMNDYVLGCDVLGAIPTKGSRGGNQSTIDAGNKLIATGQKISSKKRLAKLSKATIAAGKKIVQKGQSAPAPGGADAGGAGGGSAGGGGVPAAAVATMPLVPVVPFGLPFASRVDVPVPGHVDPFGGLAKTAARAGAAQGVMAPVAAPSAPLPGARPVTKKAAAAPAPVASKAARGAARVHGDDIFGDLVGAWTATAPTGPPTGGPPVSSGSGQWIWDPTRGRYVKQETSAAPPAHMTFAQKGVALADLNAIDGYAYAADAMVLAVNSVNDLLDKGTPDPDGKGQETINKAFDVVDKADSSVEPGWFDLIQQAQQITTDANDWISNAGAAPTGSTTTTNTTPGAPVYGVPWAPSTPYAMGSQVTNQGNLYGATTAGTSGTSGPTGTAPSITDGTVVWAYVGPDPALAAQQAAYGGGASGGGGGGDGSMPGDSSDSGDPGSDLSQEELDAETQDPNAEMAAAEQGDAIPSYGGDMSAVSDQVDEQQPGFQGGGFSQMVDAEMPGLPFGGGQQDAFADLSTSDSGDGSDLAQADASLDAADAADAPAADAAPAAPEQVVGDAVKKFVLKSEIPGVSNEAWTKFVIAMKTAELGDVSASNALGAFELKPRRLADLGLVKNLVTKRSPNGRMIWVGDFIAPLTSKKFLSDPNLQYKAFVASMKDYVQKLRSKQIPKPDGGPIDGMRLAGVLAILHRAGPNGLKTFGDPSKRFDDTLKLYTSANEAF